MIRRDLYLNQLCDYIDKPFIKVITGIRRSGKSAILIYTLSFAEYLLFKQVRTNNEILDLAG